MKSLLEFINEAKGESLDAQICDNIKTELEDKGVNVYYVEPTPDDNEEYDQLYVATCDYSSLKKWEDLSYSDDIIDLVENVGVEIVCTVTDDIKYEDKKAFEIHFADTQA